MPFWEISDRIPQKTARLLELCRERGEKLAFAESCTGGLLAAFITEHAGVSDIFMGCAVTYSNEAKHEVLGVSAEDIEAFGAVSEQTARAMARQACARFGTNISAAITGIAGPSGGSEGKPVGTVDIAVAVSGDISYRRHHFSGDRHSIRLQTVEATLDMLLEALGGTTTLN